ncbi:MAG TPA: DmsC/YnfH family molybdoenzyme membrane anchor subunit [Casimicrobiaceae bacterium]|jgi:DMSO reductase anchor subunit
MKPALSVIFFTVASGAGLGMFALLGLLDVAGAIGILSTPSVPSSGMTRVALLAFALVVAGLCASTLHLANPRNAWRSFVRFRTSWLSREAVFSAAFVVVATIYVALLATNRFGLVRLPVAIAVVALAWIVLFCTAMIYASLKPIRQWHTRWTPALYIVLGHWSGAVLLRATLTDANSAALTAIAAALGIAAIAVKWMYWQTIDGDTGSVTLEYAIGVDRGVRPPTDSGGASIMRARLFDTGHSHGTFLTDEFGFTLARRYRTLLRAVFWSAGIAIPLAWIVFAAPGWWSASLAGTLCMAGLIAERWLFFAEARHTVRLFHGDAKT